MLRSPNILLLALLALSLTGVACKRSPKQDECVRLFSIEKKCVGNFMLSRPQFLAQCRIPGNKKSLSSDFNCVMGKHCDPYLKCVQGNYRKRLKQSLEASLKQINERGTFQELSAKCTQYKDLLTPATKALCDKELKSEHNRLLNALIADRDKGRAHYKSCQALITFTKKHMPKAMSTAKTLCLEAKFSRFRYKALRKIKNYRKRKRLQLPPHCRIKYLKQFEKIKNKYIVKGFKELVSVCYEKLGAKILETLLAQKPRRCHFASLLPGYKRYKVHTPRLAPLLKKAQALCHNKHR